MKFRYLLATVVLCAAASVNAAEATDWGEVVPGQTYSYSAMTPVQGYYTPTATGTMRCYISGGDVHVYSDAAHENIINYSNGYYGSNGEKVRVYSVETGKTVYFYNSFPLDTGTFRIAVGKEPITLTDATPSADAVNLSISTNYRASYAFSIPVKCTKATIAINDEIRELTPEVYDNTLILNWFATLRQLYRDGKISKGDVLTVTISGIRDVNDSSNRPDFGDGVGKLIVKYTMAGKPAELLREVGTPNSGVNDFMTYYLPDGKDGLVKLIFSSELDPRCGAKAEIQYGDPDNIDLGLYFENPPVIISGDTLSVDLRGVRRFPEDMIPSLTPQSAIGLRVTGIKTSDGQYVLTGSSASPYSFGFSYNLKTVVYSLAADWMPASGSTLQSGKEMEIWVLNGRHISFESVDFSYLKDGDKAMVSVPYSELRVEKDTSDPDAMLYYLTVPAIDADPDSEVTVTLGGLVCADGLDHASDILAKYKAATTAVGIVGADDAESEYFDLTGRRVLRPSKGIYIRNGRKVVVN